MITAHPGILTECEDSVLTITINAPTRLNAVDADTLRELSRVIRSTSDDERIHVIVVTGQGRAFCSGADLTAVHQPHEVMDAANDAIRAIVTSPIPVLSVINGPAIGFGVSLACAADLTFAAKSAYFLSPFTALGLMPDGGSSRLVAAAIGRARAAEILLLGERLPAPEAARSGLICRSLPDTELAAHVEAVSKALASRPRRALQLTKSALVASTLDAFDELLELERAGQIELMATPEFAERSAAVIHKRTPACPPSINTSN